VDPSPTSCPGDPHDSNCCDRKYERNQDHDDLLKETVTARVEAHIDEGADEKGGEDKYRANNSPDHSTSSLVDLFHSYRSLQHNPPDK